MQDTHNVKMLKMHYVFLDFDLVPQELILKSAGVL